VFIVKYENIQDYPDEQFRRITGVKRSTFEKMLTILRPAKSERTSKGGPKPKLCLQDMLLASLEYLREYRTYAHVAASYGVCENSIYRHKMGRKHSDKGWNFFVAWT
jgi:hypothetical protein